ncbi:excalibur calcium-binding domain-containing protein [Mesorhizobium ciceri]|uniref:excalibur calcium-binding domain-containing protein n=1 Tax=Mesorhizobium TaxID=68287 RepID=UPI0004815BFC|nr:MULTISPECIES: excalibur calcium-binding domain-containing protein [Mesorhizobium]AMX98848.1 calcium-binding protein [Mesorhizobium ciceri biovar biserrulae]
MGVREFSCVLRAVLFSGCAADYLNHYDTVTLTAGDASHANLLLQTVDPFNPNSQNTHIEGDGVRAAAVVNRYRGVSAAPTQSSRAGGGDLDCAGDKGNNAVVVGPVKITNGDPNKLDRDHDGVGCE